MTAGFKSRLAHPHVPLSFLSSLPSSESLANGGAMGGIATGRKARTSARLASLIRRAGQAGVGVSKPVPNPNVRQRRHRSKKNDEISDTTSSAGGGAEKFELPSSSNVHVRNIAPTHWVGLFIYY